MLLSISMKTKIILVFAFIALFTSGAISMSHPQKQVIILLGPPGSGKGTQAKRIMESKRLPHISTGDLFRENMSKNTDLGQKAKSFINAGKLVPDALVLDMLFDRVARADCRDGYLLDGFPRTIPQARALSTHLNKGEHIIAINLPVPDEVIIKRISGRLSCPVCGAVYNRYFSPPKEEDVCDKCKGALMQRPDDSAEVVQERLRVYQEQTAPLIDFYQKQGILHTVDGRQDPELVLKLILEIIN